MQNFPNPSSIKQVNGNVTYDALDLIRDGVKAEIVLNDHTYTLRITRAGKLILTK